MQLYLKIKIDASRLHSSWSFFEYMINHNDLRFWRYDTNIFAIFEYVFCFCETFWRIFSFSLYNTLSNMINEKKRAITECLNMHVERFQTQHSTFDNLHFSVVDHFVACSQSQCMKFRMITLDFNFTFINESNLRHFNTSKRSLLISMRIIDIDHDSFNYDWHIFTSKMYDKFNLWSYSKHMINIIKNVTFSFLNHVVKNFSFWNHWSNLRKNRRSSRLFIIHQLLYW